MKKLLIILLLLPLSGCVTYYTPETAIVDGVYYAGADPAYVNNAYVSGSFYYAGAAYYPWWSMDYFYLGYQPYYYPHSPWFYPYYGHYSPWYRPYNHYAAHNGVIRQGDYCQPYNACGRSRHRYATNGNAANDRTNDHNNSANPVSGYTTVPAGNASDRGTVVRYRQGRKAGKPRIDPVRVTPMTATDVSVDTRAPAQSVYRSRRDGGDIRYRSGGKQGKSRTTPVGSPTFPSQITVVPEVPTVKSASTGKNTNRSSDHRNRSGSTSDRARAGTTSHSTSRSASHNTGSRSNHARSNQGVPRSSGSRQRSSGHRSSGHHKR